MTEPRIVNHDPRNLLYPFKAPTVQLTSRRWSTDDTPVLDSRFCVPAAAHASLLCTSLDKEYELINRLQTSDVVSTAQQLQSLNLISGYVHAFTLEDTLAALTLGPVMIGIPWYSGFNTPRTDGLVVKTGDIEYEYEVCLDEIDVASEEVWFRNCRGPEWGVNGRACMLWSTLEELLEDTGDATVLVPKTRQPVKSLPVIVPEPEPEPLSYDDEMYDGSQEWVKTKKFYQPNERIRQLLIKWQETYEKNNE